MTKRNVRSQRGEEGNQKELSQQPWAGRGAFLGDDALLQKSPEFQGWLRDTPRLLRSEQHQLLGDDTATTGRDRVGLLVYERGEGGCTVSDTVRVRDLWLFPVALSVGKPRLLSRCLAVQLWMSGNPPGARLLEASQHQPAAPAASHRRLPAWPCDWLPRNAAPRSGRGDGGGGGGGGPTPARSRSQDISGPFMGTGPSGAHATLSSVVVSLMLAYPHSSALHPCSSRFLFDCDLLPSHGGPQLSTLCLSLPVRVSLFTRWASWLPGLPTESHARLLQYILAAMYLVYMLHSSEYPRALPVLWPSDGRRLSASFPHRYLAQHPQPAGCH